VYDISCVTKIHTLALAAELHASGDDVRWCLAYSLPEAYNLADLGGKHDIGWQDIVVAPLAETAALFNEADGRGVIIPGHEGDRLVVALGELEPAGGVITVAETVGRPDLRALTERRNLKIMRSSPI
jgi:hypothetical protein